ncbi:hypothetical protein LRAMOSA01176 [Lichtheimia ramosa]|uniref:Uncharacterized protein n=1 Tax=Lichtheimia ramosa TaxID=688394 RepID=A0A077WAI6_9FUNG|nr:hypothetical protein LRAMOSA01176 [Lichtheimia ramosa]
MWFAYQDREQQFRTSSSNQEPAHSSFFALALWFSIIKWSLLDEVPLMWVIPLAFLLGVVVPLAMGLPRPNSRLIQFPAASNADCSAGVPLQAARVKVSDNSTQVLNSPSVFANQQPWVAPVVSYKASNACEYPGMLFSTRTVEQVPRGNMSALEGQARSNLDIDQDTEMPDVVPGTPELREIVENEEPVSSERAQTPDLQDIHMASPSPSPPPPPPQALAYTQMMPEQQQQQQQQELPPPPPPQLQQQEAILYTQVMPPPPPTIIHPEPTPEVFMAAVAVAAIPVVSNTGSSSHTPLQIRGPLLRPRSRLRTQPPPPRPPPRPPSLPPRPPVRRLVVLPPEPPSIPPQPPTPPASKSSAMAMEAKNRAIVRPVRRLQRHVTPSKGTENTASASSSSSSSSSATVLLPPPSSSSAFVPPPASSSSSSALPSLAENQPAPPTSILQEYAAEVDSFMGGDDILAEILRDEEDPYDEFINYDNYW